MAEIAEILPRLYPFRGVDSRSLRAFLRRAPVRWFEMGQRVFSVGDASDTALLVVSGRLDVQIERGGTHHTLGDIRPGEITGETALFMRDGRRGASLIAREKTCCLVLSPKFMRSAASDPAVVALEMYLQGSMARRIRECNKILQSVIEAEVIEPEPSSTVQPQERTIRDRLQSFFQRFSARAEPEPEPAPAAPAELTPAPVAAEPPTGGLSNDELWRRLEVMLQRHPYVTQGVEPLLAVLMRCDLVWRMPGEVICEEGAPGDALYFVLDGAVKVQKNSPDGVKDLAFIESPTMLGHMSLIDRSRRSATCRVEEQAYVAVLNAGPYKTLIRSSSPEGVALRRLILSSLSAQLLQGNQRIQRLIEGDEKEAAAEQDEVTQAMASLDGWGTLPPQPIEEDDWLTPVKEKMAAVPVGDRATLSLSMEGVPAFSLRLDRMAAEETRRPVSHFLRFLAAIPTPPRALIQYRGCTSALIARPQDVARQIRLYFPARTYEISGDEHDVVIRFTFANPRWTN